MKFAAGAWVVSDACNSKLRAFAAKLIGSKIDFLETSLFGDELCKKHDVAIYFTLLRLVKPMHIII